MTHLELKYTCHKCAEQESLVVSLPIKHRRKMHVLAIGLPESETALVQGFLKRKSVPMEVISEYFEGVEKLKNNYCYYNLVLLGLCNNQKDGYKAAHEFRSWEQKTKPNIAPPIFIMGITSQLDEVIYQQCGDAGISHVVEKGTPQKILREALRSFMWCRLTVRQQKILTLYNKGHAHKEAANMLNIAVSTYASHLASIREKFGISTRKELLALEAILQGK